MSGNPKISGNTGNGVHIIEGTLIMDGGEISNNGGSGVYAGNSSNTGITFTMNAGKISGNEASGVYIYYSLSFFTMNGGEISNNTSANNGGGVCLQQSATFTMNDGIISGNTADLKGGGVYNYNASFAMTGWTISDNSATEGGGVYVNGLGYSSFTMSGGARVTPASDGGNSVCLMLRNYGSGKYFTPIIMGGAFTGPAGTIAKIDLEYTLYNQSTGHWVGENVLSTDPAGGVIAQSVIDRFPLGKFVNNGAAITTNYKLDTYGRLVAK
jgi:hypothetical protein